MFGAIAGDIIGSVYEHNSVKAKGFRLLGAHSTPTDEAGNAPHWHIGLDWHRVPA
ncbi:hypothetical protein GCM10028796_13570 [Ramlibacter monticola]|uniref:ADP-ribosylglycohydrolase family protein n=1 Tax=Ramlibacter monticola TaxID=1926872 RepID=A0A936YWD7_9BURK|nr:hypothetical protein [Ramlibacter monticola]MBL0390193.1 hypothetical protein [Ramlibacter monticola]